METKNTPLIADNSKKNREILTEILGNQYHYLYADNGAGLIELLSGDSEIDLILLNINMPQMDGFEVLKIMNERLWIEEIPVVIISAETDTEFLQRAYQLGAIAYISRPFSALAVQHRVKNTLALYSRQKRLVQLVEEQVYEREKINTAMINIFSHSIELRNNESGSHTLHMRNISKLLLHRLTELTDRYQLTENDISLITTLSSLHDIGKISVPESILNKPGTLTAEEWEIMKSHTTYGDELLKSAPVLQTDAVFQTAHEICRWHHERWDGKGYPDGLSGDEIPISAQVVAMADVYDALTSDRAYKKAYSHECTIEMICNGECGAFNPLLIQCLLDVSNRLADNLRQNPNKYDYMDEAHRLAGEMLNSKQLPLDDRSRRLLNNERTKKEFFQQAAGGIQFEYDHILQRVTYIDWYQQPKLRKVLYLNEGDDVDLLSREDWLTLQQRLNETTPERSSTSMTVLIPVNGAYRWHRLDASTVWPERGETYLAALGQFTDIHDQITQEGLSTILKDEKKSEWISRLFGDMFDMVRLVDPADTCVLAVSKDGELVKTNAFCYETWNRTECCENCISSAALSHDHWTTKLEVLGGSIYSVISRAVTVGSRDCVLEIVMKAGENPKRQKLHGSARTNMMLLEFYRDALTNAYSRMYLEDFKKNLENTDGVAILDVDHFKKINDQYGHPAGDAVLKHIAEVVQNSLSDEDTLIRYGGDEFLLLFHKTEEDTFRRQLRVIRENVETSALKDYPGIQLKISIGGAFRAHSLDDAIQAADAEMYQHKNKERPRHVK